METPPVLIFFAVLILAILLSSCDLREPQWTEGHEKIEADPFGSTLTPQEDLEFAIFESKVIDNRDIVSD
jgi:hypothetical protein